MTQLLLPRQKLAKEFALDPSLVLYLPLYELDGASFMSKDHYGHIGTIAGGALWTPQGRSLNGINGKITLPAAVLTSFADQITLLMWMKTTEVQPTNQELIGIEGTQNHFGTDSGAKRLRVSLNATGWKYSTVNLIDTNIWALVGYSYNGSTLTFNIDGASAGSFAYTGNISTGALVVGYTGTLGYFEGTIGEVLIYSKALSASEIQNIYLSTRWRYQ